MGRKLCREKEQQGVRCCIANKESRGGEEAGQRGHTMWSPEAYVKYSGLRPKSNGKPLRGFNWGMDMIKIGFAKRSFRPLYGEPSGEGLIGRLF